MSGGTGGCLVHLPYDEVSGPFLWQEKNWRGDQTVCVCVFVCERDWERERSSHARFEVNRRHLAPSAVKLATLLSLLLTPFHSDLSSAIVHMQNKSADLSKCAMLSAQHTSLAWMQWPFTHSLLRLHYRQRAFSSMTLKVFPFSFLHSLHAKYDCKAHTK